MHFPRGCVRYPNRQGRGSATGAAIKGAARKFAIDGLRPHPDPDDDEVGIELFATLQCDAVWIERSRGGTEVERDAVLLVE